jgi:hypothetical protein
MQAADPATVLARFRYAIAANEVLLVGRIQLSKSRRSWRTELSARSGSGGRKLL